MILPTRFVAVDIRVFVNTVAKMRNERFGDIAYAQSMTDSTVDSKHRFDMRSCPDFAQPLFAAGRFRNAVYVIEIISCI
jgi:hypothetical protein